MIDQHQHHSVNPQSRWKEEEIVLEYLPPLNNDVRLIRFEALTNAVNSQLFVSNVYQRTSPQGNNPAVVLATEQEK